MLKIPKGLKKKKKGKKGKHKGDEDLFTPEELEAYRREKALKEQQQQLEAEQGQHEEEHEEEGHGPAPEHKGDEHLTHAPEDEDRFQALLGGVDSILNKTQRDLDRIKSTSFFQRKPTPSELNEKKSAARPDRPAPPASSAATSSDSKPKKRWVGFEEGHDEFETDEEEDKPAGKQPAAAVQSAEEPPAAQSEESGEEEEDDADDIFDTSYIDVITSGEVKLAYIPESPVEEQPDGDDPFDTTYAAKVIGNDEDIKRRQKLEKVSLGIAVDVLTGKAAPPARPPPLPENAVAKRAVPRRVKPVDLLKLESVDKTETELEEAAESTGSAPVSLLDDDALLAIPDDLPPVGTPIIPPQPQAVDPSEAARSEEKEKQLDLSEFDVIAEKPVVQLPVSNLALVAAALGSQPEPAQEEVDDELEDEFAALAAESLQKKKEEEDEFADVDDPFDTTAVAELLGEPAVKEPAKPTPDLDVLLAGPPAHWSAFDDDEDHQKVGLKPSRPPPPRPLPPKAGPAAPGVPDDQSEVDPFDTSIAHNILPGKTELKLIEKEILGKPNVEFNEARILSNSDSDFDFNPREGEESKGAQSGVSIHVTDPAGRKESPEGDPFDTESSGLTALRPIHRDLLGGSTTDLSKLAHDPIEPAPEPARAKSPPIEDIEDPFDTSGIAAVAAPGKAELKYLEREILGDVPAVPLQRGLSDEGFDPRAEERCARPEGKVNRPDVLVVQTSSDAPTHKSVAFALPSPAQRADLLGAGGEEGSKFSKPLTPYYPPPLDPLLNGNTSVDPFDTTHVTNLAPGKTELKILENELVGEATGAAAPALYDEEFDPRAASPGAAVQSTSASDIFAVGEDIGHKPLTPNIEEAQEVDPFDTSIASNIKPGKAELKVLEKELISEDPQASLKRTYTDPDFNPRDGPVEPPDLLNEPETSPSGAKPLTPEVGKGNSFENGEEDIDPFDTAFASEIRPGKAELRVLETELIGKK